MKLRESEALGALDHDDRRVRHVDADLDHGRGDHDVRDAAFEQVHAVLLVGGLHLAVHDDGHVLRRRKCLYDAGIAVLQVLIVHFFGLLDQRVDDVDLPSPLDLVADESEYPEPVRIAVMNGFHRLAARRQLVDHRHVQIAVERHRQRSRNRGGGHHEHMGSRLRILAPQPCPLLDAETVLLVDHDEAEITETDSVLDQRMRSDQYVDLAREQAFGEFRALLLLRRAGQQADAQADPLGHPHDRRIMLRRENLRRSHQAGLKAVVASQQHAHQCDERLAAAHIALQQAVHLMPGHGVLTDFADHALLRPGQRKRQPLVIKRIEKPAHGREQESVLPRGAGMSLLQNIELDAEQLVELET